MCALLQRDDFKIIQRQSDKRHLMLVTADDDSVRFIFETIDRPITWSINVGKFEHLIKHNDVHPTAFHKSRNFLQKSTIQTLLQLCISDMGKRIWRSLVESNSSK